MNTTIDRRALRRLFGDPKTGHGGLCAPFTEGVNVLLRTILDNGPQPLDHLVQSLKSVWGYNDRRIIRNFGNWEQLVLDMLALLTSRQYVEPIADAWQLGRNFQAGVPLSIYQKGTPKMNHPTSYVTVYDHATLQTLVAKDMATTELNKLIYDMRSEGAGFRSRVPHTLAKLRASMRAHGWQPGSFIISDDAGHIIDGRHRWLVAKELDITPQCLHCPMASPQDLVRLAWYLNRDVRWRDKRQVAARIARCDIDVTIPITLPEAITAAMVSTQSRKRTSSARPPRLPVMTAQQTEAFTQLLGMLKDIIKLDPEGDIIMRPAVRTVWHMIWPKGHVQLSKLSTKKEESEQ